MKEDEGRKEPSKGSKEDEGRKEPKKMKEGR
jgi:hypothetical protein